MHTVSASKNRYSNTSFTRQPGGTATEPYEGWFVDIWDRKFRDDIVWLAEAGITAGCGDQLFCPNGLVTRAQMASFLMRAFKLPPTIFGDDAGSKHEDNINRLAASGITSGCGTNRFCPAGSVTRGQMSAFLRRGITR